MNWSGSFSNSVLPSHAVISECSIKAYIDSQHGLIRKSLYLLPATLKKDRSQVPVASADRPTELGYGKRTT